MCDLTDFSWVVIVIAGLVCGFIIGILYSEIRSWKDSEEEQEGNDDEDRPL